MAKSFAQLQQEIAELESKASTLRAKQVESIVASVRRTIDQYGLTAQDVFGQPAAAAKKRSKTAPTKKVSPSKGRTVAIKYRDADGNTWTGRGNRPRWLVAALAGGSKSLEDFAV